MRRKDWVGAGIGGVIAWFGGAAWAAEPPLFAGYPVTEGLVITAHLKDESPTVTSAQSRHGSTCYVLMWVRRSGFIQAVQVVKSTGFERLDAACIKGVVHQTLIPASDGTSPIDAWEILPIEWRGPTGVAPKASTYGPAIAVIAPNQTLNVDKVPASALALKDASCLVHVSVSASGSAEDLTVARSSGSDDLDRVCMDALRSLEFIPARNEGRNVAGIADVWIGWPASDVVTPTEIGSLPSVQFIGDRLTPGKDLIRALHAKADLLTLDPVARSSKHAQCMVSLWYAGDGTIHAAQLVVPSGLPVVDQACLQTVLGRKVVPPVGEQEFGRSPGASIRPAGTPWNGLCRRTRSRCSPAAPRSPHCRVRPRGRRNRLSSSVRCTWSSRISVPCRASTSPIPPDRPVLIRRAELPCEMRRSSRRPSRVSRSAVRATSRSRAAWPRINEWGAMKLQAVRRHALSLPRVTEEPHFDYTSFRVAGKIFATSPPPGDRLHVFIDDTDRDRALALHAAFIEKLYWGEKVCGVRILLSRAKPAVVRELLMQAWRRKAPKRLVSSLAPDPSSRVRRPKLDE
jgi:TonB family protein